MSFRLPDHKAPNESVRRFSIFSILSYSMQVFLLYGGGKAEGLNVAARLDTTGMSAEDEIEGEEATEQTLATVAVVVTEGRWQNLKNWLQDGCCRDIIEYRNDKSNCTLRIATVLPT